MINDLITMTRCRSMSRCAAALVVGGLLAAGIAGCGGGGGSSSSGPTAPGLPVTPTSGDFNDLVVRLDVVGGSYNITKLAAESNGAPYTTFGSYVPNNPTAKTPLWLDSTGTTATATSPVGFYIDDTSDPTVLKNATHGIWYSQTAYNTDNAQHVLVLKRGASTYYLAFEDLSLPHNDTGESEPTLKQILAADGAVYGTNTVQISQQTL